MKKFSLLFLLLFICAVSHAQVLKKLGKRVKENVEWRAQRKANQKIDQGLDSLEQIPKKMGKKKKEAEPATTDPVGQKNSARGSKSSTVDSETGDEEMGTKDGHILFSLSANTVFTGGSIRVSGESVIYKTFKQVEITVKGPSTNDSKSITLQQDGKFITDWNASDKTGEFTITITSSDKKAKQSASFSVEELPMMDDWTDENKELTNKAYDKLKKEAEQVKTELAPKDAAELDKKIAGVKEKVDAANKLFNSLNKAGKEIARQAKTGKNLSPNLAGNLSELNNILTDQRKKMKQLEDYSNHKPFDNTVCEYLVMLNEACAAFSTFTNFYTKSIATVVNNIALDKGVPKVTSMINERYKGLPEPTDFALKEPAKIFATAGIDAESLGSKLGIAGFAGDVVQFATDYLLKKYCGIYKGELKHDYTINFRNSNGILWWKYGAKMEAVFSLRYPKDKSGGKIIKMKGNLEGNATNFTFFQDIKNDDGFKEGSKDQLEVIPLKTFTPVTAPFVSSKVDALGFGAVARGLATPACFNIRIDAEYDTENEKITIFFNEALIDFTALVKNEFYFVLVGGDLLPYIKKMTFPIHKAAITIKGSIKGNNEFDVKKDKKGNLSFSGKASRHLGSPAEKMEHFLNYSLSAKKD